MDIYIENITTEFLLSPSEGYAFAARDKMVSGPEGDHVMVKETRLYLIAPNGSEHFLGEIGDGEAGTECLSFHGDFLYLVRGQGTSVTKLVETYQKALDAVKIPDAVIAAQDTLSYGDSLKGKQLGLPGFEA